MDADGTQIIDLRVLIEFIAISADRIARGGQEVTPRERELYAQLEGDLADHRRMLEFMHQRQRRILGRILERLSRLELGNG